MKTLCQNIKLNKTSGTKILARADDIFSYTDSDFERWNTGVKSNATEATEVAVCEMTQNATFAQIFTHPDEMCLSQHQIIDFVEHHKDKLRHSGYSTFFLFKVGSEFFVASVSFGDLDLYVYVYRLSDAYVWDAGRRHRFVLPQLALKHVDPKTLSPSDFITLEQAIEKVKEAGYVIYKQI